MTKIQTAGALILVFLASLSFARGNSVGVTFPKLKHASTFNLGPGCRFNTGLPDGARTGAGFDPAESRGSGGMLIEKLPHYIGAWELGFNCYSASDHRIYKAATRFDAGRDEWVKDFRTFDQALAQAPDDAYRSSIQATIATTKIFDIKTINAHGWAMTGDDLIGDEEFRTRGIIFCIFYKEKVLCGNSTTGYLEQIKRRRKADYTPNALEILRSIEFIEDAPLPTVR